MPVLLIAETDRRVRDCSAVTPVAHQRRLPPLDPFHTGTIT
jgi:hypothetical protein